MIALIWAMDENGVIGNKNQLPWHLPEDLKFFKKTTMSSPIIMGRKTWDSIGRPLPGRKNIVITRNTSFSCEGCEVIHSIEELEQYRNDSQTVYVIGGAEIFSLVLPVADRLILTKIHAEFEGDTYFPSINWGEWKQISSEKGLRDEKNPYDYEYLIYDRLV